MMYIGFEGDNFTFTELHRQDFREVMYAYLVFVNPPRIHSGFAPVPRKYERMRYCA